MAVDTTKKNHGRPNEFTEFASSSIADRIKPEGAKNTVGFITDGKGEKVAVGNLNWAIGVTSDWEQYCARSLRQISQTGVQEGLNIHLHSTTGTSATFSLYGESQAITFAYHGSGSEGVLISTTDRDIVQAGDIIEIDGSTDNDGQYRVNEVVYNSTTTIQVFFDESLTSSTADGTLYLGGTLLTDEGALLRVAPQLGADTVNIPAAPGNIDTHYFVFIYDEATNVLSFSFITSLATQHNVISVVKVENVAGVIDVLRYEDAARYFKKNYIVVGDGKEGYNSENLNPDAPIQDAIDKINERGGGTVFFAGSDHLNREIESDILIKSNVTLDGLGQELTYDSSSTNITMQIQGKSGVTSASITITGLITIPGVTDFNDYGIGSKVYISAGADSGTWLRINRIFSATNCECVNLDSSTPALNGGVQTITIFVNNASVKNMGINHDTTNAQSFIKCSSSYNAEIDNVVLRGGTSAGYPSVQVTNTFGTKIHKLIEEANYTYSIIFTQGNTNAVVKDCRLTNGFEDNATGTATNCVYANSMASGVSLQAGWSSGDYVKYSDDRYAYYGDDEDQHTGYDSGSVSMIRSGHIMARYHATGASSSIGAGYFTAGNTHIVYFDTKDFDAPNAIMLGSGSAYTLSKDCTVNVSCNFAYQIDTGNWTAGDVSILKIFKNGAEYGILAAHHHLGLSEEIQITDLSGSTLVECASGDVLTVRVLGSRACTQDTTAGIVRVDFNEVDSTK